MLSSTKYIPQKICEHLCTQKLKTKEGIGVVVKFAPSVWIGYGEADPRQNRKPKRDDSACGSDSSPIAFLPQSRCASRGILRLLLEHPLLSDEELAALLDLERKSVRCLLYELHRLDCLETIVTVAGKRWHLCERGLRLIAYANHTHIRDIAVMPDGEAYATHSSDETDAYPSVGAMDNDGGAPQRVWSSCRDLGAA
jgi:hypothetical protein